MNTSSTKKRRAKGDGDFSSHEKEVMGKRLVKIREALGLNQAELSKQSGLSINTISRAENGHSKISIWLALYLVKEDINLNYLFNGILPIKRTTLEQTGKKEVWEEDREFLEKVYKLLVERMNLGAFFSVEDRKTLAEIGNRLEKEKPTLSSQERVNSFFSAVSQIRIEQQRLLKGGDIEREEFFYIPQGIEIPKEAQKFLEKYW